MITWVTGVVFETDSNMIIHLNNLEYIIIIHWPSYIKLISSQESYCTETEERQFSLLQFGPSHFQNRIIVTQGRFMARHKNCALIRLLFTVFTCCVNYRNCIENPVANLGHAWTHMTSDLRSGFCHSQTRPCTNSSKLRKRFERVTKWNSRILFIEERFNCCLLKSVLIAIRGFRGKRFKENTTPTSSLSFNLIDFDKVE